VPVTTKAQIAAEYKSFIADTGVVDGEFVRIVVADTDYDYQHDHSIDWGCEWHYRTIAEAVQHAADSDIEYAEQTLARARKARELCERSATEAELIEFLESDE